MDYLKLVFYWICYLKFFQKYLLNIEMHVNNEDYEICSSVKIKLPKEDSFQTFCLISNFHYFISIFIKT